MATNGTNTLYFNDDSNWLDFNWEVQSLDPANKKVTIAWNVTLNSDYSGAMSSNGGGHWQLNLSNPHVSFSETQEGDADITIGNNISRKIASGTWEQTHSSQGYTLARFSLWLSSAGNSDIQFTTHVTLDAPPKGAVITSAVSIMDTENPEMDYTLDYEAVDSLVGRVIFGTVDGVAIVTRNLPKVTSGSYIFQLTDTERADIRAILKNTPESSFTYEVISTFSGTPITHSVNRTITIVDGVPTLNPVVTNRRSDNFILAGDNDLTITPNAVAYKGATISSIEVWYDSTKVTGSNTSIYIQNVNTSPITVVAIDSRGFRESKDITIDLVPYQKLTCVIDAQQSDILSNNTVDITFDISGQFYNGSFNDGGSGNAITLEYRYKINDGSWSSYEWHEVSVYGHSYSTSITFNTGYQNTISLEVKVSDTYSEVTVQSGTVEITPVFDWSKEDFNFNVPVTVMGHDLIFIEESGTFYHSAYGGSGTFYYRKWSDGNAEIWGRVSLSGVQVNSIWGNMYTSGALTSTNVKYPTGFFSEEPCVNVSLAVQSTGGIIMSPGGSGSSIASIDQTGVFEIARGTSYTGSFTINYDIKGRWN